MELRVGKQPTGFGGQTDHFYSEVTNEGNGPLEKRPSAKKL